MAWHKIADTVVRRLVLYLRVLEKESKGYDGATTISSYSLAEKSGVSPALVRKDLAWFGEFGTRGVGYDVEFLKKQLRRILNLNREVPAALMGVGSLGMALTRYNVKKYASDEGFNVKIVACFDNDPNKIGRTISGVPIYDVGDLDKIIREQGIQMGIIAVPADEAQGVANRLVENGIRSILNFAPAPISVPDHVQLQTVDFSLEMQYLAYYLNEGSDSEKLEA